MTPRLSPPRRVGRPSNLTRLGVAVEPGPLLPAPTQALLLTEIADVLHGAGEAIRLLADSAREASPPVTVPEAPAPWLTLGEASALAKVSRDTLVRWIGAGRLTVIRDADGEPFRPYR